MEKWKSVVVSHNGSVMISDERALALQSKRMRGKERGRRAKKCRGK